MAAPRKYPDELRERAVRLVFESGRPIAHVARDLGMHPDHLTTTERERMKALEREVKELRRANEILKAASVFFAKELDQPRPR